MDSPARSRISLEDYFAMPETMLPMELIDGEIEMAAAPAVNHQRFVYRLSKKIDELKPDGEVIPSPVDVVINASNVLQPDILWISDNNERCSEQSGRLYGAPDLVVEISSPSTARNDRTVKFNLYESAGVREYWIVEPQVELIEVWTLIDNQYVQHAICRAPQIFVSPALNGATIALSDIFPQTT